MKRNLKKIVSIVIVLTLAISLSTVSFAAGQKGGNGKGQKDVTVQTPKNSGQGSEKSSAPAMYTPNCLDTKALADAIAALDDAAAQTELTSLLTAYETALVEQQEAYADNTDAAAMKASRNAVKDALRELMAAMKDAGITIGKLNSEQASSKYLRVNVEALSAAIAAVTDSTVKTYLTGLLTTYTNALDAQKDAVEANADETTLAARRTDVQNALSALLDAMNDAGVAIEGRRLKTCRQAIDVTALTEAINALTDSDLKDQLKSLLNVYTNAVNDENAAIASNLDVTTLAAFHNSVCQALWDLRNAVEDAGLNLTTEAD